MKATWETRSLRTPKTLLLQIDMAEQHTPVLERELVELIGPTEGDVLVDCTFGAGGHALPMAGKIGKAGKLYAIDRDPTTKDHFEEFAQQGLCEARFINDNFEEGLRQLVEENVRAGGIYMDLGMSSMQLDARERGFSYSYEALLDMRMDPAQELSAYAIVNDWPERKIAAVLREYGEERYARRIAGAIVRRRSEEPIKTTTQLVDVIKRAIPKPARFGGAHPARRTFQALRIAVNDELGSLERSLPIAWKLLDPGGTLAVISFHSLEDRIVKQFIAERCRGCICPPDLPVCGCGRKPDARKLTRKPTVASEQEVAGNSRSRAAKLRAAAKLEVE